MPSIETLIAFVLATAVFAYMPGPAMLYATAQTIARGRKGGLQAAFGIHIGGYVHVIAAALGLAVLFMAVPLLYGVLKILGAAYLIYLGIRFILKKQTVQSELQPHHTQYSKSRAFLESVMVEVLNPKTALFYIAFLPQFTDPAALFPLWLQLLLLGTIVNIMFSSADLLCVLLAHRITSTFQSSSKSLSWANKIGGGVLIGLGVNLAVSK